MNDSSKFSLPTGFRLSLANDRAITLRQAVKWEAGEGHRVNQKDLSPLLGVSSEMTTTTSHFSGTFIVALASRDFYNPISFLYSEAAMAVSPESLVSLQTLPTSLLANSLL